MYTAIFANRQKQDNQLNVLPQACFLTRPKLRQGGFECLGSCVSLLVPTVSLPSTILPLLFASLGACSADSRRELLNPLCHRRWICRRRHPRWAQQLLHVHDYWPTLPGCFALHNCGSQRARAIAAGPGPCQSDWSTEYVVGSHEEQARMKSLLRFPQSMHAS